MKKGLLPLCMSLLLLVSACGDKTAENTPSPAPEPTPVVTPAPLPEPTPAYTGALNPLSGLPIGEAWVNRRPIAIMLNNLKEALPQQGQSQADIIYEVLAEGGITRMMGVYQSMEGVGMIGSVRSSRPYYIELALGHDAVYIHAGGSEDAYAKLSQWKVTHLDGVRGPYMSNTVEGNLMWRDPQRRKTMSAEHTVVTTGAKIQALFPTYQFRQEHEAGYLYEMNFEKDGTPAGGSDANELRVRYSSYKTGTFTYDPETKLYLVGEYGKAYIDGNTDEQVGVTNVVVIRTDCKSTGDSYAHITVDLASGGTGYFACGGKLIDILWSKDYPSGQLFYTDLDGNPFTFGAGHTYVNIVPTDAEVTLE